MRVSRRVGSCAVLLSLALVGSCVTWAPVGESVAQGVAARAVKGDPGPLPQGERDLEAELGRAVPESPIDRVVEETSLARTASYDPTKDRKVAEDVSLRSEGSETWRTESGRQVSEMMLVPKWFRSADGSWQPIDSRVVPDRERGGFRNAGASWSAHFGVSGEGVEVAFEGRSFRVRLEGRPDVAPEADKKSEAVVWYRDIAPEVDARFTVHPSGIEQDYVIRSRAGLDSLAFFSLNVESEGRLVGLPDGRGGLALDFDGNGKSGYEGEKEPTVRFAPPSVFDALDRPLNVNAELVAPEEGSKGPERGERPVAVGFDKNRVRALSNDAFPVTILPA